MDKKRKSIYVSSSIANFKEKLAKRTGLPHWSFKRLRDHTIFFGLYHPWDYFRFLIHRGRKTVFWCGGDILNLGRSWWRFVIPEIVADHFCENSTEWDKLYDLGIIAATAPMIFDDPEKYQPKNKKLKGNHLWMCVHPGREEEYGLREATRLAYLNPKITVHVYGLEMGVHPFTNNVVFHGLVPEEQFNKEIRRYHGSLRLNKFDGMGEVTAKSLLLGQLTFSRIHYPFAYGGHLDDFVVMLQTGKSHPTTQSNYWRAQFEQSLKAVLA